MSADIKQIKNRIKSVDSTLHITKAMKLVASSKIHRAESKFRSVAVYADALYDTIGRVVSKECLSNPFVTPINPDAPVLYIVIAADRGLAGSFNGNVNRLLESEIAGKECFDVLPIGKRICEYAGRKKYSRPLSFRSSEHITEDETAKLISFVTDSFREGKYSAVYIIGTKYKNVLTQNAEVKPLLPIPLSPESKDSLIQYEPGIETVMKYALPMYIGSIIRSSVAESLLSEQYARRNAMDSASKNADEMIEKLSLSYNRARQNTITQEITEIVAGANAETV